MALRFIGIDPETGREGSPTIWVDESQRELVLQGFKPGAELEAECAAFEVPGHASGIPPHESVVRMPFRMVPMLKEACDAAERTGLL